MPERHLSLAEPLAAVRALPRARPRRARPAVPGWGVAAVVLGVAFGAALGHEREETGIIFVVALAVLVMLAVHGLRDRAPARPARPRPVVRAVPVSLRGLASEERLRRGLWLATALTLFIVAADVQGKTLGGAPAGRYSLLVVPFFALLAAMAVAHDARFDRPTVADRYLIVLVTIGVIGALYGQHFRGTATSGFVIFLPMTVGLAHLVVRGRVSEENADRYVRVLVRLAVLFLVLGVIARTPIWPFGLPSHVAHERSFFVAMGFAGALFTKRKSTLVLIVALTVTMFLQYPAATWIVVAGCVAATGYATSRRGRSSAALVLAVFAVGVFGFGFVQVQAGNSKVAHDYFSSVGKGDNTDTRSQLWRAAEVEIKRSPLIGTFFTGNFTVENVDQVISNRGVQQAIEPHNDYIEMLLLGGLFGLFLFVGFIVATNVEVIRRVHLLADQGATAQSNLARMLLIGFNAALVTAFFNPVLSQLGICASIFVIYALMMSVHADESAPVRAVVRR